MSDDDLDIRQLSAADVPLMEALSTMFGEAFEDPETYGAARPGAAYLERLLARDDFIALAALKDGAVVGGLAAYQLHKFEQERSEVYLYDLAVASAHRREGIATALIEKLRETPAGGVSTNQVCDCATRTSASRCFSRRPSACSSGFRAYSKRWASPCRTKWD